MKKEKGITLIALIITIIVMLILVAVTLTMTLGENGIVKKAQSAKQQQAKEITRERVQSCLSFDSTGEVNIGETVASLQKAGGTITSSSATEITAEMDGYTFTISKNGNVVSTSENGGSTEGTTTGQNILDGTYYGYEGTQRIEAFRISGTKFTMIGSGGSLDTTCTINENSKTITVQVPREGSNGEVSTENFIVPYEITNNNKILTVNDGESNMLYSTTTEGFEYNLSGDYVNVENSWKYNFNSATHVATCYYYSSYYSRWELESSPYSPYFGFNGKYYIGGTEITSSDNYQSFTLWNGTYTKATD